MKWTKRDCRLVSKEKKVFEAKEMCYLPLQKEGEIERQIDTQTGGT